MAIQLECPGCKTLLQIDESLAGKQGKCIHCGHRVTVPAVAGGASAAGGVGSGGASAGPISPTLFEATPEAMMRELGSRGQSAVLFLFRPTAEGSYDLADVPDADLKCIVTDDVNPARFAELAASITKRFAPQKKGQPTAAAPANAPSDELLYELKGDRLGMGLDEFKRKYARGEEGSRERLPMCSDAAWGVAKLSLHSQTWHQAAGIISARIDLPAEDNSPTVAGVKTELLLYQFIDGLLFRIAAFFPTDLFHIVCEAALIKYGPVTHETHRPRQLVWENALASVILTRGTVHPPEPSTLHLIHKELATLAESRAPTAAEDI